eukprot:5371614-Prymnesium_polylepis.1
MSELLECQSCGSEENVTETHWGQILCGQCESTQLGRDRRRVQRARTRAPSPRTASAHNARTQPTVPKATAEPAQSRLRRADGAMSDRRAGHRSLPRTPSRRRC